MLYSIGNLYFSPFFQDLIWFVTIEYILPTVNVKMAFQIRASIVCTFFASLTSIAYLLFNPLNSSFISQLAPNSFGVVGVQNSLWVFFYIWHFSSSSLNANKIHFRLIIFCFLLMLFFWKTIFTMASISFSGSRSLKFINSFQ